MPAPTTTLTHSYSDPCAACEDQRRLSDEYDRQHRNCDTDCAECYPDHPSYDCECDDCYNDRYDEPEDEGDYDVTDWTAGLEDDEDVEGTWLKPTRTIGCEFERSSWGNEAWRSNIPRGVGVGSDHCGPEVRTPPLKGRAADRINERTLRALIDGDTRVASDSGLHVHVHFPEGMQGNYYYSDRRYNYNTGRYEYTRTEDSAAKATAFAKLYALWYAVEHITYRFDTNRRRNSYSEQFTRNRGHRIDVVDRALTAAVRGELPSVETGRYNSMNMSGGYGTVEVRNHGSSNDVTNVMAWLAFCQGMVDLSLKLSPISIRRLATAKSHNDRARLLMRYAKQHNVFTPTAYAAIRKELGLRPARGAGRQVAAARRAA